MFLTKQGGMIIRPVSILLGKVLNLIYDMLDKFGIVNIGLAIILFTLVIRLCLLPLMFKQNKSSKVMNYIQPEISKATKKYKGKRDQESLIAQQRETKTIQNKYGISMTSGCLTSILQLPIFFALYRVVQNVPAYVDKVYNLYKPIANAIYNNQDAINKLTEFQSENASLRAVTLNPDNIDTIVDVLAKFSSDTWEKFSALFNNQGAIVDAINVNVNEINHVYSFFGINLTSAPGFALTAALVIPILSMVFQFLSMHVTPQQSTGDPSQQASMKTMRMMMNVMPIMSFFVCVNVPSGVGLYWAAGSFVSFITGVIINYYYNHCDMEKVVEKCKVKAKKKNLKKKKKGKKSFMERLQESAYGQQEDSSPKSNVNVANASLKSYTSNTMSSNRNNDTKYRAGSLASKANVMQRLNDNNEGGKN